VALRDTAGDVQTSIVASILGPKIAKIGPKIAKIEPKIAKIGPKIAKIGPKALLAKSKLHSRLEDSNGLKSDGSTRCALSLFSLDKDEAR